MEKDKLKQTQNCTHKKGFFRRYFGCMSGSNVTEKSSLSVDKPPPKHNAMTDRKTENQVIDCCTQSSEPTLKTLLEAPVSNKNKNDDINVIYNTKHSTMNKEKKDQLVKTILSKYLEVKRSENSKPYLVQSPKPEQTHTACLCPDKNNAERDIDVEYFSSDDSAVRLELPSSPRSSKNSSKPKTDFPTKTKSAPTTSVTRDSLADICYKLCQFKQSDSSIITSKDTAKKKLELVFHQSYSEEMSSSHEDSSTISLQYKISCERTGTQRRPDSVLEHRGEESSAVILRSRVGKGTSQELHVESSTKSAIGAQNEASSSSLKWKLIISHHHGDS